MYVYAYVDVYIHIGSVSLANPDLHKQIRKSSCCMVGKTGLKRCNSSWVIQQARFLGSRLWIYNLNQTSIRAGLLCDLNLASIPLDPKPSVAQASVGFVACGCFQGPGSGESIRSLPCSHQVHGRDLCLPIRLWQTWGTELSDGMGPSMRFSRTRSEISPVGSFCASKNTLNYN